MTTFDQAFQEQLAAHYFRDDVFVSAVGSLVKPEYFDSETLQALVAVQGGYLAKYNACCTLGTFVQVLQRELAAKRVKIADMTEVQRLLAVIHRHPLKDRQFVIDTIAEFARHQALLNATMTMADALDTHDPTKIDNALKVVDEAKSVGAVDHVEAMDFTTTRADRIARRRQVAQGSATGGGITTGMPELDKQLTPWNGWGRKELSILMAPPKGGKTAGMIQFAIAAAAAGHNVFYASCEVSEEIIGNRSDANISGVPMKDLVAREREVEAALAQWEATPGMGRLDVQAFPIRTLKVSELTRVLKKKEAAGISYDMIVVDYLGIMRPEMNYGDNKRFGLAEIGQDLRALGTVFNAAVLTAYQTNREGAKKAQRNVTDGTDAAEDYEAVRTADVLITINASPDDRQNGEVVLYFSEMRNAESGLRMRFSQDLGCMRFLISFVGYD
ncbi:DnaB-like helicase C-terminal domain-containing protein [Novosphingobium sp. NPDC080210]|uniref:DnaB-like helicase C-terminal domain-containing protein n=1 Tax=Novosphingobium sp. NPDC080210 TaxID=3390596 RepID=UPI003D073FF3